MDISPLTSTRTSASQASGIAPGGELGEDAFLKLLVAQLKNQDPLSPVEDKDFMAQMAQFRMLEQLDQLNQIMSYQVGVQSLMQATGLLGKEVTAQAGKDAVPFSGLVSRVGLREGEVVLTVNGKDVFLSDVVQVGS